MDTSQLLPSLWKRKYYFLLASLLLLAVLDPLVEGRYVGRR